MLLKSKVLKRVVRILIQNGDSMPISRIITMAGCEPSVCPGCGAVSDGYYHKERTKPSVGEYSICAHCNIVARYNQQLILEATDFDQLAPDALRCVFEEVRTDDQLSRHILTSELAALLTLP